MAAYEQGAERESSTPRALFSFSIKTHGIDTAFRKLTGMNRMKSQAGFEISNLKFQH
jgi:hypothetical protein